MPCAFEGSSFLLTYPQSDFELNAFLNHLLDTLGAQYARVCSEQHADGSLHRHAVAYWAKKIRVGARHFDYEGRHPNVKTVGRKKSDWTNCVTYVSKDGSFLERGTPRHSEDASVWSLIARATSREEVLSLVAAERPRDYVINRRNIDYFLDQVCLTHFHK